MYGVITTEMLARSFMILVFMFLMLTSGPSLVYMCCTDEEQPISDCSYSYHDSNNNKDNVSCKIRGSLSIDTCLDWYGDPTDIPGAVEDLTTEYYYTSCSPTVQFSAPLAASSCHTHCNHDNERVYLGLNITFKADKWTSEDLGAISISLRREARVREQCIHFYLDENRLTTDAVANHYFYYDGFIGLQPGIPYTINVIALLTDLERSNRKTIYLKIPPRLETCWKPELLYHDTPFAVNITLFQDTIYYFEDFYVSLGQLTKEIYFDTSEAYEMDGKLGINIMFECQQPRGEYLIIVPKECPYCVPYKNEVHIQEAPPSFLDCPRDEIIYEVKLGRYFEGDMVKGINWTVPTPIFQNKCQHHEHGINSTHTPMESAFIVGRKTPVTYQAWQYNAVAECTFQVDVTLVADDSVSLALIIGVSCSAGILLIIILGIILYCVYTKRCSGIHTDERSISGEEHGIPMGFLRNYQDSQPSLNSSKINGSQGLKYPKSTKQVNLPSTSGCYSSLPSIMTGDHATSGYMSNINANSDQPRHIGEVGMALIRRGNMHRCNSEDEDGDSVDSLDIQVSYDDPGPMSMDYHLTSQEQS